MSTMKISSATLAVERNGAVRLCTLPHDLLRLLINLIADNPQVVDVIRLALTVFDYPGVCDIFDDAVQTGIGKTRPIRCLIP